MVIKSSCSCVFVSQDGLFEDIRVIGGPMIVAEAYSGLVTALHPAAKSDHPILAPH
jgi:hypothetical protein